MFKIRAKVEIISLAAMTVSLSVLAEPKYKADVPIPITTADIVQN